MKLPDDVWLKIVRDEPDLAARRLGLLSDEEQGRLERFAHHARRTSFVLGRAAARLLVADRLAVPVADVRLEVAPDGAVDVAGADLCLSISHSREMAAVAVAERAIGLDVERIRPPHPGLHERILSPREQVMVGGLPVSREEGTLLSWTLKEAVVKGLRTGLRRPMRSLELDIDYGSRLARVTGVEGEWEAAFAVIDTFMVSVAYRIDGVAAGEALDAPPAGSPSR